MSPWQRLVSFNAVGALGIGVQMAVLWALTGPAGLHYLPATALAVVAAVVHNFVWHRVWTWRDRPQRAWPVQLAAFALANGAVSFAGNLVLMAALVGLAGLAPVPANAFAIAACGLLNFWLADRIVFYRRVQTSISPDSRFARVDVTLPGSCGERT